MRSRSYAGQRGPWLSLRTGHAHQHVFRRDKTDFLLRHERLNIVQIAAFARDIDATPQRSADQRRMTPGFDRSPVDGRDPRHVAGEACDRNAAFAFSDNLDQAFAQRRFRPRLALDKYIGGVTY